MKGYFRIRLLETCSICCVLGLFPTLAANRVASVRAISFLTFLESPAKSLASMHVCVSARQVSGMIISSEEVLGIPLNEPEPLALTESCGEIDGAEPGETVTVGDGERLLGELIVTSEFDVESY